MADGDLNIRINTSADPKGLQEAKKQLDEVKQTAEKVAPAVNKANKEIEERGKNFAQIYRSAGGGARGFFAVITGGAPKAAAALAVVTTAAAIAKKALVEYGLAEGSVRRLQATLAQNGHLTSEVNEQYQELASTLQKLTGRADDEWIDVLRRLTQFGATPGDIQKHVTAVRNLAGIMDGDLSTAAAAVSKAMEGEFHAFTRLGIQFDEHATKTEKLEHLYRELAAKGGGQLEATTEGLTGHFDLLKNSVSELFEAIGQRISDTGILQYTLYGLGTTIGWVADKIGHTIGVTDGLRNGLKRSAAAAQDAEKANLRYNESLKETEKYSKAVSEWLDRQLDARKNLKRIQDEEADAQMAFDLALVDRAEKQGLITPDEAIARRGGIRARAAGAKHQREQGLRTEEILHRQKQIDHLMAQVAEANNEAEAREGDLKNESSAQAEIARLNERRNREVSHWQTQLKELNRLGGNFRNEELGATDARWASTPAAGNFTEDMRFEIESRIRLENARFNAAERRILSGVSGSRKAAVDARAHANKIASEAAPTISNLTGEIDSITAERAAADNVYRINAKQAAMSAGTEAMGANPQVNTKAVESEVIRASAAFQGQMDNLGSTIVKRFETDGMAIEDLARRLKLLEQREKHRRNP